MGVTLHDRSVIVTGASGALGSRITGLLAARGARLTVTGRDRDRLAAAAPEGATTVVADLTMPGAAARVVAEARNAHGGIDGIVHAAGVVAFAGVGDLDDDTFDDVLDELVLVTLAAPVRLMRAALPALCESAAAGRDPFACHISGVVAERPVPGMSLYSAVKAALTAFDAAASLELRRARVRVLDVRPPHTETGLARRPLTGTAPALPPGKDPDEVAARIVRAIEDGERDLPSTAF